MLTWILDRAKEKTTWIGLTGIITAAGVGISPDLIEAIVAAGVAVSGLILAITKENLTKKK